MKFCSPNFLNNSSSRKLAYKSFEAQLWQRIRAIRAAVKSTSSANGTRFGKADRHKASAVQEGRYPRTKHEEVQNEVYKNSMLPYPLRFLKWLEPNQLRPEGDILQQKNG